MTLNPLEDTLQELFQCFVRKVETEKLSSYITSKKPEDIKSDFYFAMDKLVLDFINDIDWEKIVWEAEAAYARKYLLKRFVKQRVERYKQVDIHLGASIESFLKDDFRDWMRHQVAGWVNVDIDWSVIKGEFEGIFVDSSKTISVQQDVTGEKLEPIHPVDLKILQNLPDPIKRKLI